MDLTLPLSVLGASLLGSVHCAAMCGSFVCAYAAPGGQPGSMHHVAYNGARLVSYLILGVVAGVLGSALDDSGALVGIGRMATIVAGVLLVAWGTALLLRTLSKGARAVTGPQWSQRLLSPLLGRARQASPTTRAATIGLLSALLPCGWLYAFVVTAGGTGSVSRAVVVMLVFWVGTLPAMLAAGVALQRLSGPLRARLPLVTALAVMVMGALSIVGRIGVTVPVAPTLEAHGHTR